MIPRIYDDLEKWLEPNKVLILYGPRQIGKTTLLKNFLAKTQLKYKLENGDNLTVQDILSSQRFEKILPWAKGYDLIAIDEAQKIPNIGVGLKILVDQVPNIKIIATGSSSFKLKKGVGEPLVGRAHTLKLYPVSQLELSKTKNMYELASENENFLIFGSYPTVLNKDSNIDKSTYLSEVVDSYLLKDILELDRVKGSNVVLNLLKLIAFQVGGEVSLTELGSKLSLDVKTVARYLNLLEQSFIIFSLYGFSRNLRKEITKMNKYYFYDNGIRNAIIQNFNDLETRNDVGALWENFIISERIKKQEYSQINSNNYFWRTWDQKEIDWIEERAGKIYGYEMKYGNQKKSNAKKMWLETYKEAEFEIINKENFLNFIA